MPSDLPVIKVRTNLENVVKMKTIAKCHKKSVSKEIEGLIEKHIEEFETEHGEIELYRMPPNEIIEDIKDRILHNPPY